VLKCTDQGDQGYFHTTVKCSFRPSWTIIAYAETLCYHKLKTVDQSFDLTELHFFIQRLFVKV